MKQLVKISEPEILRENAAQWTEEYAADIAAGRRPHERWRHADIGTAIKLETGGKCAYCESRMHGITWAHVEHIHPKSVFPELVVAWSNLTSACPNCNINKGSYYSDTHPILHPYHDAVETHLIFVGTLPFSSFGDNIGARTIALLKLDRPDLVAERERRIRDINQVLEAWATAEPVDQVWMAEGIRLDATEGEFSSCVIQFLRVRGFPL